MSSWLRRFPLDSHHRFIVGAIAGLAAFLCFGHRANVATRILFAWDFFAAVVVAQAWTVIASHDPYEVRRNTRLQDASSRALFAFVVSAAVVSLFAVAWMLQSARNVHGGGKIVHLGLGLSTVAISWILIHTLFCLRYAHVYYRGAKTAPREQVEAGLIFPGKLEPDFLDFAYFSFVVGMTCQVSDVQVATRPLRRIALVHGLISFLFNTAILAMLINTVANML